MRLDIRRYLSAVLLGGALCWNTVQLRAAEPQEARAIFLLGDGLEFQYDPIRMVAFQPESSSQPFDPGTTQPFDDSSRQPFDQGVNPEAAGFGGSDNVANLLQRLQAPSGEAIGSGEVQTSVQTDLGSLLQDSNNIQTIGAQRRSQVAFDPRIRAYHYGQMYAQAEGQYFLPVRLDLDSMLNKIDPSLIQSVTIIPGPYGVRFGPGFSFIDVDLIDTPRYCDCPQAHGRMAVDARSNGGQTGERIAAFGGGSDYGYILHYGHRKGSDYTAGNGQLIPSSYQTQNVMMQFGFDVSPYTKTEIRYSHMNMGPTEYALQFFDISTLKTNALNVITTTEDPCTNSVWVNQVWTNATDFRGDNRNDSKQGIRGRVADALTFETGSPFLASDLNANVSGDLGSHGARSMKTYGDDTTEQLRVGADFRYVAQSTKEQFRLRDVNDVLAPDQERFDADQPRSVMTDPGAFLEMSMPWTSYLRVTGGARVDWVNTHRAADFVPQNSQVLQDFSNSQDDTLGAGYLVADIDLSCNWKARVGAGYAERVPDLVNRYSDGIYISMIQSGFSKVIGLPSLKKEQAAQIDASLRGEFDYCRIRGSVFHSRIHDYNTYVAFALDPPTGAQFLAATNTPLATLQGFEAYADYDVNEQLTFFGSVQYVEGTDESINQPLPGIYPFESRVGLRITDECDGETWGLEWGWRIVSSQDRVGTLRSNDFNLPIYQAVETRTGGFATSYIKGYYNYSENMHFITGIDNMFDRNYIEHLDLRFTNNTAQSGPLRAALAPGFTAYGGVEFFW